MKKTMGLSIALTIFFAGAPTAFSSTETFLGAPLVPQGKVVKETKSRLEMEAPMSHDRVLAFYKQALKEEQNIKYRNWKDATYIEDDGARPWHSITISKGGRTTTRIVIMKDNWTWIIGTLVLRFIAVFIVLLVLFLGMSISGKIIFRLTKKPREK